MNDWRTLGLGAVAWASALVALRVSPLLTGAALVAATLMVVVAWRRARSRFSHGAAWLVVAAAVGLSGVLHREQPRSGSTPALAEQRATIRGVVEIDSDPRAKHGRFADYVLIRATLRQVDVRGTALAMRAPVLLVAPTSWRRVRLGQTIAVQGRLAPSSGADLAAVVDARGPPRLLAEVSPALRAAAAVRAGVREAVARAEPGPRALIPALVDGDDSGLSQQEQDRFRTTGLTHLLAVSGTNLTIVVGFLLLLARGCGVRARGLLVVGAAGVVGFVLLARPEPSVLRAAAMGSVALIGMSGNGRSRGIRALGVAVLLLLLFEPALAMSVGFALSALATGGILLLAPGWRDAMARWMPLMAAEMIAVPMAAQLACTPVVAAISGQVSVVAVLANLLAGPVVGPATVLGFVGGVLSAIWVPLGQLPGAFAGWCGAWIIAVANRCAALPGAAFGWSSTPAAIALLTLLCVALCWAGPKVLRRRGWSVTLASVSVAVLMVPVPTPGWPPPGWVMVACDIGQGDGLVLNAGPHAAVVVDTGPDPALMDACLRRLGIRRVALVVLTHFHADHIDGLAGVLAGRRVDAIEVTTLGEPAGGSREVRALATRARVPVRVVGVGETMSAGELTWRAIAPYGDPPPTSESPPNDSSIVLYLRVRGVTLLLMGDEEQPSQAALANAIPTLHADVLKVAHHGSAKQDPQLVRGTGARLAVISCGVDNDYGHPAPSTLRLLRTAGMAVRRTDTDGDVAVVVDPHGGLGVATRMPYPRPRPGQ